MIAHDGLFSAPDDDETSHRATALKKDASDKLACDFEWFVRRYSKIALVAWLQGNVGEKTSVCSLSNYVDWRACVDKKLERSLFDIGRGARTRSDPCRIKGRNLK